LPRPGSLSPAYSSNERPRNQVCGRSTLVALVTCAALCTSQAHGVCLQLPSAELRAIDDLAEGYPERGLAEANRRLAQAAVRHEPFIEAQLHAIIAAVRAPQGSIERVCALAARADLRAESLQLDNAAADGIAAYTTAEHEEFEVARIQAAVSLAEIYRRRWRPRCTCVGRS